MGQYNSSDVRFHELDLSQIINSASTAIGAMTFASKRGRINERVFISDTQSFIGEYGKPDPKVSFAHYAALAFLEEGNQLWCNRVVGGGATYGGAVLQQLAAGPYNSMFSYPLALPDSFDPTVAINGSLSEFENLAYFYAIGPGSYAKDVEVQVVSSNMRAVGTITTANPYAAKFLSVDNLDLSAPVDVQAVSAVNVATLSGATVVGGVTPVTGNKVLLTNQTTVTQNGVWLVDTTGAWTQQANVTYVRYVTGPAFYKLTAVNTWTVFNWTINGVAVANNDIALLINQTNTVQNGLWKFSNTTGVWTQQPDQPQVVIGGLQLFNFVGGNYVQDGSFVGTSLAAGQYEYRITACNISGETIATIKQVTTTDNNSFLTLNWPAVDGATSYKVYGRTTGAIGLLTSVTTNKFIDYGLLVPDPTVQAPTVYAGTPNFQVKVFDMLINPSVPRETWDVTFHDNVDGFGQQTELAAKINDVSSGSKYIRVTNPARSYATVPLMFTTARMSLAGGNSGSAATDSDLVNGWNIFADKEQVNVTLLINGGYSSPAVQLKMDAIATTRQDAIAILDLPSSYQTPAAALDYRNNKLNLNSNYSAIYGPDLYILDSYNGIQLYVPPSGHIAAVYARNDRVADAWFAPAGLNRGQLKVLGLRQVYNSGDRELLAGAQINYVRKFPGQGYVVMEAWTLQAKMSALSFVPVRRLLIVVENAVAKALLYSLWEPNDPILRLQIVGMIADYLETIRKRRGINKYLVVCDDSNNSPNTTGRGVLNVDVYVEPTLPVQQISLRMIVTRQGMSFQEAIRLGAQS